MGESNRFVASKRSNHPLSPNSNRSLRVPRRWLKRANNHGSGFIFIDNSITRGDITKWTVRMDPACQIGPFIRWNGVLIVFWITSSPPKISEKSREGVHFHRLVDNQWRYRKTEGSIPFSASNRSFYPLTLNSNCSFGVPRHTSK